MPLEVATAIRGVIQLTRSFSPFLSIKSYFTLARHDEVLLGIYVCPVQVIKEVPKNLQLHYLYSM